MQSTFKIEENKSVIKRWLLFFMIMLFISGVTTIPAVCELSIAMRFFDENSFMGSWLSNVYVAVKDTSEKYPYLFYGYDWLACLFAYYSFCPDRRLFPGHSHLVAVN